MKIYREPGSTTTIHGTLLRLGDKDSVAIYFRDGVVSVADFREGRSRILSVAEWHSLHARRFAHAQRRGEVEIVSPIPGDVVARIERLHYLLAERPDHPLKRKPIALSAGVCGMLSRLSRLLLGRRPLESS
jgi:hypothetical protein